MLLLLVRIVLLILLLLLDLLLLRTNAPPCLQAWPAVSSWLACLTPTRTTPRSVTSLTLHALLPRLSTITAALQLKEKMKYLDATLKPKGDEASIRAPRDGATYLEGLSPGAQYYECLCMRAGSSEFLYLYLVLYKN